MYRVNEIPVRTTNSFKVNDLEIDLNIPTDFKFTDYETKNIDDIEIKYSDVKDIEANNIVYPKCINIDINIKTNIKEPIYFTYNITDNLVNKININFKENSSANIIFKYISSDNNKYLNSIINNINVESNSNANITYINLLNSNSINLLTVNSNISDSGLLNYNLIDIGGCIKINNILSTNNINSKSYLNNIYLGKNNDIIDMNYNYKNIGDNSISEIDVEGVLDNNSTKTFKGTIDFIPGSYDSVGKEKENCLMLTDKVISRSVPLLLCGEENVEGAHSVSTGKIDKDKLFYLMNRGMSKEEAEKLIITANFTKILDRINDDKTKDEILEYIN